MEARSSASSALRSPAALQRLLAFVALGVLPVLLTAVALWATATTGSSFAVDFHQAFWGAGQHVLHGESPYPSPDSPVIARGAAFVYPAPAALLLAPFALLPQQAADWVFTLLTLLAVPATLLVLGVRDWRVYGIVLLWGPVVTNWHAANVTTLLGLGIAIAWRWRSRPVGAGAIVGLLVAVKVFLWPLGLWLLATRRYRAFGWSAVTGLALNLVGWSILGWDELPRYLDLMDALTAAMGAKAYSLATLGAVGIALEVILAGVLVAVGLRGDRQALTAAVAVALLLSPLVWSHYFALLLVPIALAHPRLHWTWGLPVLMWAATPAVDPEHWQLAVMLTLAAVAVVSVSSTVTISESTRRGAWLTEP
jgi:Glycosyltransferase family 87